MSTALNHCSVNKFDKPSAFLWTYSGTLLGKNVLGRSLAATIVEHMELLWVNHFEFFLCIYCSISEFPLCKQVVSYGCFSGRWFMMWRIKKACMQSETRKFGIKYCYNQPCMQSGSILWIKSQRTSVQVGYLLWLICYDLSIFLLINTHCVLKTM